MRLRFALLALAALASGAASAQEALPARGPGEKPGAEPKLFLDDLDAVLPGADLSAADLTEAAPPLDVERAKAEYERAARKQQRWQRLYKSGVVALVEAEAAALQAARARAGYERARATEQQRVVETLRPRVAAGQLTADALAAAESALETAQTMVAEAEAALRRTELLQAEANVDRQRRLAAVGAGSKRMLQRAQATLEQLRAAAASPAR